MDIVDTVNILTENKINILELGLTLNRVYLLIYEKDKADFIRLFKNMSTGLNKPEEDQGF